MEMGIDGVTDKNTLKFQENKIIFLNNLTKVKDDFWYIENIK